MHRSPARFKPGMLYSYIMSLQSFTNQPCYNVAIISPDIAMSIFYSINCMSSCSERIYLTNSLLSLQFSVHVFVKKIKHMTGCLHRCYVFVLFFFFANCGIKCSVNSQAFCIFENILYIFCIFFCLTQLLYVWSNSKVPCWCYVKKTYTVYDMQCITIKCIS